MVSVLRLLVLLCLLLAAYAPAQAETQGRRVALVIGNGAYESVSRLANPTNDAKLIADTLQGLGFILIGGKAQTNLSKAQFDSAVESFGNEIQGASVALFYYAGHGMQVDGANFLVPVNANPTQRRDLPFQMVDAQVVLSQMEGSGTKLNIVILDACRNNPFGGRGLRAATGGLAQIKAPEGTLIAYATQPGAVASDGTSGNSPFTKALAETMRTPGLPVFQAFNQVGLRVKAATGGAQQPWLAISPVDGEFYFANASPAAIAPAPSAQGSGAAALETENLFWQSIVNSTNPADFNEYLRQFPKGRFAGLAANRAARQPAVVASASAAAPKVALPAASQFQTGSWLIRWSNQATSRLVIYAANGAVAAQYINEKGDRCPADGRFQSTTGAFALDVVCPGFGFRMSGGVMSDGGAASGTVAGLNGSNIGGKFSMTVQ